MLKQAQPHPILRIFALYCSFGSSDSTIVRVGMWLQGRSQGLGGVWKAKLFLVKNHKITKFLKGEFMWKNAKIVP